MIETSMVSTSEIFTDNSPMSPGPSVTVINTIARKPLFLFTEFLDVKKENSVRWVGASKSRRRSIIGGSMLWSSIPKMRGNKKSMNGLINIFIIGVYNILRLCSIQLRIIALKFILMVTLNHSWF